MSNRPGQLTKASEKEAVKYLIQRVENLKARYKDKILPGKAIQYIHDMNTIIEASGCSDVLHCGQCLTETVSFSIASDIKPVTKLSKKGETILGGVLLGFGKFQISGKVHGYINPDYFRVLVGKDAKGNPLGHTGIFVEPEKPRQDATEDGDIRDMGKAIKALFEYTREEVPEEVDAYLTLMENPADILNRFSIYVPSFTMCIPKKMEMLYAACAMCSGLDVHGRTAEQYLRDLLKKNATYCGFLPQWTNSLKNLPAESSYEKSWKALKAIMGKSDIPEERWITHMHVLKFIRGVLDHPKKPLIDSGTQQKDFYVLFPTIFHCLVHPRSTSSWLTLAATEGSSYLNSWVEELKNKGLLKSNDV